MSDDVQDSTAVEPGALPRLDGNASVLGEPTAKTKSNSNVRKLFYLAVVLVAFLFIVFGILWFLKHRAAVAAASARGAQVAVARAAAAQKNAALKSEDIERTKAALKARQAQEDAAKDAAQREAGAASAAAAAAAATTAERAKAAQSTTSGLRAAQGAASASALAPARPTLEERRMSGEVLVNPDNKEVARASAAPAAETGSGTFGQVSGGEGLAARLHPTVLDARSASRLPNLDYLLKRGTSIPCAAQTGIDTTLPGVVICKTLNDVYSANSKTLLFERGTTVFGEQQSTLKQGQARTFVLWTRIDSPSGVFANVDSPATDQMGYSGVEGYVDTHFWQRFGSAIMLSLISDFGQALSTQAKSSTQTNTGPTYNSTTQAAQNMAVEALRNSINIPPALYVRPGRILSVMVARDVSFENVYSLVK